MPFTNIEIKARCQELEPVEQLLKQQKADFIGLDHQVDTYYKVPKGRLKLRSGNIENALIHYQRPNQAEAKKSTITHYKTDPQKSLKAALDQALEVLVVVDEQRKIFFIENVKFHLDVVKGLGTFVEIEAIDKDGTIGEVKLHQQCMSYMKLLGIEKADLVEVSYSDLLLDKT